MVTDAIPAAVRLSGPRLNDVAEWDDPPPNPSRALLGHPRKVVRARMPQSCAGTETAAGTGRPNVSVAAGLVDHQHDDHQEDQPDDAADTGHPTTQ